MPRSQLFANQDGGEEEEETAEDGAAPGVHSSKTKADVSGVAEETEGAREKGEEEESEKGERLSMYTYYKRYKYVA